MSDGFKDAARTAAAELGIEKTPEEWERLVKHWIAEYREENPAESESMTDLEVFKKVIENTKAQIEKSESNLRSYEEFIRAAPTDAKAEKFVRDCLAEFAENCPMELLTNLSMAVIEFRRREMKIERSSL